MEQAASTAALGRPAAPGGLATATLTAPATRAGMAHINTDDGYVARPPGA
jgi:hypothetical protein